MRVQAIHIYATAPGPYAREARAILSDGRDINCLHAGQQPSLAWLMSIYRLAEPELVELATRLEATEIPGLGALRPRGWAFAPKPLRAYLDSLPEVVPPPTAAPTPKRSSRPYLPSRNERDYDEQDEAIHGVN